MENQPLEGRVALVAGASRAAGRGIAVELGAAGATVHFVPEVQDAGKPANTTGYR
ncbi:MAG TPA: hypothetical protein VFV05_02785 [Methylomirabilota bacterium]|jgi:NAD(P)-dependent dehydrogenase (short-subunit alcohol dehydrogenase family)|nr:hypothetical protein [Methylomirabilota bacterium]